MKEKTSTSSEAAVLGFRLQRRYKRVLHENDGPSLTKQSEKDSTDIHKILAKYALQDIIAMNDGKGVYIDVSSMPDYQQALKIIEEAEGTFEQLPAELRSKLGNSPENFLKWIEIAKPEELKQWGLTKAMPVSDPKETTTQQADAVQTSSTQQVSQTNASNAKN